VRYVRPISGHHLTVLPDQTAQSLGRANVYPCSTLPIPPRKRAPSRQVGRPDSAAREFQTASVRLRNPGVGNKSPLVSFGPLERMTKRNVVEENDSLGRRLSSR